MDKLPTEIIHAIALLLPNEAANCFALCNKNLWLQLPDAPFGMQKGGSVSLYDLRHFLSLLCPDLPDRYPCQACNKLYYTHKMPLPRAKVDIPSCETGRTRTGYSPLPRFSHHIKFAHVQLAMERHHHGRERGIPLAHFLNIHTQNEDNWVRGMFITLSVRARIVADRFLVCSQIWIVFRERDIQEWPLRQLSFCCHGEPWYFRRTLPYPGPKQAKANFTDLTGGKSAYCKQCPTNAHLQSFTIHGTGWERSAICLTKWSSVSDGSEIFSQEWRSHFDYYHPDREVSDQAICGPWIRRQFETGLRQYGEHGSFSLADITSNNMNYLRLKLGELPRRKVRKSWMRGSTIVSKLKELFKGKLEERIVQLDGLPIELHYRVRPFSHGVPCSFTANYKGVRIRQ